MNDSCKIFTYPCWIWNKMQTMVLFRRDTQPLFSCSCYFAVAQCSVQIFCRLCHLAEIWQKQAVQTQLESSRRRELQFCESARALQCQETVHCQRRTDAALCFWPFWPFPAAAAAAAATVRLLSIFAKASALVFCTATRSRLRGHTKFDPDFDDFHVLEIFTKILTG